MTQSISARGQVALLLHLLRWIVLGGASGVAAGIASFVFLEGLDAVTETRVDHPQLVWFLPVVGLVVGAVYHYGGGRAGEGNALLLEQIHRPTTWVPRRMAPLVLLGTWATHLFGGSAGREGTALQMSGSLSDLLARTIRLGEDDRRLLLVAALAGGFGAVFGVPIAGAVFAMEVQSIGRVRYEALVPSLTAAVVGHLVVGGLGHHHAARPALLPVVDAALLGRVAVAGVAFGLAAAGFVVATHTVRTVLGRLAGWPPLRPAIGGAAVVGLTLLTSRDYLGLSLPLIDRGLAGDRLSFAVFALKVVFTAITLGSGFPGGEVTPLFVIGTTLGAALATPLGLDVRVLAAVGFVAVFAGAANTPLACTIMGVELFGSEMAVPLAVACVVAYVLSDHRGIYGSQRIHVAKGPVPILGRPTLAVWGRRRRDPHEESDHGGDPTGG